MNKVVAPLLAATTCIEGRLETDDGAKSTIPSVPAGKKVKGGRTGFLLDIQACCLNECVCATCRKLHVTLKIERLSGHSCMPLLSVHPRVLYLTASSIWLDLETFRVLLYHQWEVTTDYLSSDDQVRYEG